MSKINSPNFLVGFALGAAAGSTLALLLAPTPGQETQQRLREKAPRLGGRGKEAAQRVLSRSRELAARSWAGLTSTAHEGKTKLRPEATEGPSGEEAATHSGAPSESS